MSARMSGILQLNMIFDRKTKEILEIYVNDRFELESIKLFLNSYQYNLQKMSMKIEHVFWEEEWTGAMVSTTCKITVETQSDNILLKIIIDSFRKHKPFSSYRIDTMYDMKLALRLVCNNSLKSTTIFAQPAKWTTHTHEASTITLEQIAS